MKIKILENLSGEQIMRRAGYGKLDDRRSGKISFTRKLGSGFYPRFHVYIEGDFINLHLDQKQVSYRGSHAHSGEYDSEAVEQEALRIKNVISDLNSDKNNNFSQDKEKKGFWGRLFS